MDMLDRMETAGNPETLLAHIQNRAPSTSGGVETLVGNLERNLTALCRRAIPRAGKVEVCIDLKTATVRFSQQGRPAEVGVLCSKKLVTFRDPGTGSSIGNTPGLPMAGVERRKDGNWYDTETGEQLEVYQGDDGYWYASNGDMLTDKDGNPVDADGNRLVADMSNADIQKITEVSWRDFWRAMFGIKKRREDPIIDDLLR